MNSANPHPRAPGKLAAGGVVLFLGALGLFLCLLFQFLYLVRHGQVAFQPRPLASELRDFGFACLASGTVQPPVEELTDGELQEIAEIIGRLVGAYERADFESFLALRTQDLAFAAATRAGELEELRAFARELQVPEERLDGDWVEVLGEFWSAYYPSTAAARFLPEESRIELHREGLDERSLEGWKRALEADPDPGRWRILHELAIPHSREVESLIGGAEPPRRLVLDLAYETREGSRARLITRFVWDGVASAWFVSDAVSEHVGGDHSERYLIL